MKSIIATVLLATVLEALPAPNKPKTTLAKTKRVADLHTDKNTVYNYFAGKMSCDKLEYADDRKDNELRQRICLLAKDTHDYFSLLIKQDDPEYIVDFIPEIRNHAIDTAEKVPFRKIEM